MDDTTEVEIVEVTACFDDGTDEGVDSEPI